VSLTLKIISSFSLLKLNESMFMGRFKYKSKVRANTHAEPDSSNLKPIFTLVNLVGCRPRRCCTRASSSSGVCLGCFSHLLYYMNAWGVEKGKGNQGHSSVDLLVCYSSFWPSFVTIHIYRLILKSIWGKCCKEKWKSLNAVCIKIRKFL